MGAAGQEDMASAEKTAEDPVPPPVSATKIRVKIVTKKNKRKKGLLAKEPPALRGRRRRGELWFSLPHPIRLPICGGAGEPLWWLLEHQNP